MSVHVLGHVHPVRLTSYPLQCLQCPLMACCWGVVAHTQSLLVQCFWQNRVSEVGPGWYFLQTIPSTVTSCGQSCAYLLSGGRFQCLCGWCFSDWSALYSCWTVSSCCCACLISSAVKDACTVVKAAVLKITGGHRSFSDQFAHMTAQLTLELIIWSDHSLWLYCSIN